MQQARVAGRTGRDGKVDADASAVLIALGVEPADWCADRLAARAEAQARETAPEMQPHGDINSVCASRAWHRLVPCWSVPGSMHDVASRAYAEVLADATADGGLFDQMAAGGVQ